MKLKNTYPLITGLILLFAISFESCVKQEFKDPDFITPTAGFQSNSTIAAIKSRHIISGKLDTIVGDSIISGVVIGNDESGNIYKYMIIQDSTGGIVINMDKTSIYNEFKIGQRVLVKCKGLVVGDYSSLPQLGLPYLSGAMWTVGRISDIYLKNYLFKDDLPGTAPTPKVIRSFNAIQASDWNTLVQLTNVSFADADLPYSETTASTSRTLMDSTGATITVRTSNYANFASSLIPRGVCDIVGIMGHYGQDNQFLIRDKDEVVLKRPYILQESFTSSLGTWSQYSVTGAQIWVQATYSTRTYANMSGYVNGSYYANEDWLISPSLNLDSYNNEKLKFETAMKYGTAGDGSLRIFWSNDYTSGDPNVFPNHWHELTANLSTGLFTWTSSGEIDLSQITGSNVHIAFRYYCSTSNVPTWEIDNIILMVN